MTQSYVKGTSMRYVILAATTACPLVISSALFAQHSTASATSPSVMPTTAAATLPADQGSPSTATSTNAAIATTIPMRDYDPKARVMFNFSSASVDSVLDYMSESLGFIVIKETRIDSRVTISSRTAVTGNEAVDLLNNVLKPLNYTAVQNGRTLRILSRDRAKKANIPVYFGADPAQIRATDELITQVIPLGQVDAVKLRQDLTNLFSPDADIAANQGSNTLIITDSSANIRRIVEIISALNRHTSSNSDIKIFQLQYASATNAAKLINEVFKADDSATQQQSSSRFGRFGFSFGPPMPGMPSSQDGAGTGTMRPGKVTASADDRTNTLVVAGPKDVLPVVERVVKQLDSNPAETSAVFVYSLRNGQAQHLQDVLNNLFGTSSSGSRTTSASSGSSSMQRTPYGSAGTSRGSSSGFGGSASGRSSSGGFGSTGSTAGGFGSSGGFGSTTSSGRGMFSFGSMFGTPSLSSSSRQLAGELAGQVYVVADTDTNSIIVTTQPKLVDRVKQIIAELDRSVPQVLIKVLLAEVTHENGSDLGFQASWLNKRANGFGQTVGSDFGLTNSVGGMVVSVAEENFQATLRALATEGKVDVLSRPYILASDNQLASILVGQHVPFITNTRVTDTGQTINTVEYEDIGIILNVTPHINPDGKVIMDVAPEISSLLRDTTVKISDTVSAPVFSKRSAQSRVAIENGRTIVIGGLMEDKKDVTIDKVPLLGDIPVLGALFRRTRDSKSKTELLIFLTPHVAMDSSVLKDMSKDEIRGVKITPDAVAPGTFQEHMQGMQRGTTTAPSEPIYVPPAPPAPATRPARRR